MYSTIPVWPE